MGSCLINSIKPSIIESLDKAKVSAPKAIDAGLTSATKVVAESVTDATALFNRLYADAAARLATWIPTMKPALTGRVNAVIVWAKAKVKAL